MKRETKINCPINTKLSLEQQEKVRKAAHIIIDTSTDFALVYFNEDKGGGVSMVSSPIPIIENLTKIKNELTRMVMDVLENEEATYGN